MKRIAFGHKARTGKDTAADWLVRQRGFTRIAFADALYRCTGALQTALGRPVEKDRGLLQGLGLLVRNHYGERTWINIALTQIEGSPDTPWVVSDVRFRNEASALRENGFTLVKIVRPGSDAGGAAANAHVSETELDDFEYDYTIVNDGTLDELYAKIAAIIDEPIHQQRRYTWMPVV